MEQNQETPIDKFWLDDFRVLYNNNNFVKFIPQNSMTKTQQLNAITRFSIYAFILIFVFENNDRWLYVPIVLIIMCVVLYKVDLVNAKQFQDKEQFHISPKQKKCTKPTKDNPFMNFMLSDYIENPDKPEACNSNINNHELVQSVNKDIDLNFNFNLYRDIDDIFEKKNSQRQFYTMPNTQNPNDQKSFAEWLYKVPETCKTDQAYCLKYEDLRYKRQ